MIPLDATSVADGPDDVADARFRMRRRASWAANRDGLVDLHTTARRIVADHWELLGLDDPWPNVDCPARQIPPRTALR